MGVGIRFDTGNSFVKTQDDTKQVLTNIPQVEAKLGNSIAHELEDAIKKSIGRKGLYDSGQLKSNVDVKQSKSGKGGVKFEVTANAYNSEGVNYAAWHEYATSGHFVPFYSRGTVNQSITRWAKEHGVDNGIGLHVTPVNQDEGSFMEPAVQESISKARKDMRTGNNAVNKSLRKAYNG